MGFFKYWWMLLAVVLLLAGPAMAAGALTTTTTWVPGQNVKIVQLAWTADGSGDVSAVIGDINGYIFGVKTAPGATTAAPTDNYDVYIKDTTYPTLSLLGTSLENRDEANTELVVPSAPVPVYYGTATLVVAAAGDANTGTVYLYVSVP